MKGKHLGVFLVIVLENRPSLHTGDDNSEEERERRTLSSGTSGDEVEVVPPPTEPWIFPEYILLSAQK